MNITKQTNLALRTLVYCAVRAPKLARVSEVAAAYSVSELSLSKFIRPLVDSGMLATTRGRGGGIALARPAKDIKVRDVVELTEESFALAECFETGVADCPLVGSCDVNLMYTEALHAFMGVLGRYTIADLARRELTLRELLGIEYEIAETVAAG